METITFTQQRKWRQQIINEALKEAEPKLQGSVFNVKEVYRAGLVVGFNEALKVLKLQGKLTIDFSN